jgi:DNA-directed RNA polymerase sigma subunit (sigma70/sigma32)
MTADDEPDRLADLAAAFSRARAESADLKARLKAVQAEITTLRPGIAAAIAEDIRTGRRTQVEISRMTGYTAERIRQICRAAGVESA